MDILRTEKRPTTSQAHSRCTSGSLSKRYTNSEMKKSFKFPGNRMMSMNDYIKQNPDEDEYGENLMTDDELNNS